MKEAIPHLKTIKTSIENAISVAEEMDGRFAEVKFLRTQLFVAEDELNKVRRLEQMDDESEAK